MKVLIADPDPGSRDTLRRAFAQAGDQVRGVATLADAEKQIAEFLPDAVVAAWEFPGEDAGRLLDAAGAAAERRGLFALVDQNRLADAVAAMERGAEDFLWRPVSPGRVAILRSGLLARRQRERLLEDTRLALARAEMADALAGRSASWQAALATIEREAVAGEPVLITGEAGTEKEPAARALHRLSARGSEPFLVAVAGETPPANSGATIFVPGVERGSAAFQRELLAELHGPSTRRLILGTDQDPRDPAAGRL
ncbi:MAG TPA: sigma 54-interacting transcriptional regulator, partial [Thermoanaerobaculia bacterium]|nr:sigma 54-interacting transcriptional regulator [Thermoanaerobaculia bacterium]